MTRLTDVHSRIVGPSPTTNSPDSGGHTACTTQISGERAPIRALVMQHTTTIKLIGRQEGNDSALLERAYGDLLSPSDIAAMRTAGPGDFITIFGTEAHQRGGPATDQDDPPYMWPTSAAEEE